jgi:hypothetical protein
MRVADKFPFEIDLSWQADPGAPPLALTSVPTRLAEAKWNINASKNAIGPLTRLRGIAGGARALRKPSAVNDLLRYVLKGRVNRQYRQHGYRVSFSISQSKSVRCRPAPSYPPYRGLIVGRTTNPRSTSSSRNATRQNALLNAPFAPGLEPVSAALRALVTSAVGRAATPARRGGALYDPSDNPVHNRATTDIHLDSWSLDTAPRFRVHGLDTLQNMTSRRCPRSSMAEVAGDGVELDWRMAAPSRTL